MNNFIWFLIIEQEVDLEFWKLLQFYQTLPNYKIIPRSSGGGIFPLGQAVWS